MTGSLNANRYGITQLFGQNPAFYKSMGYSGHPGLDVGAKPGNPVYCEEDGTVNQVQLNDYYRGNCVYVRTRYGTFRYEHMTKPAVRVGQVVKRGSSLGTSGYSGLVVPAGAGGAHIHIGWLPAINNPFNGYKGQRDPLAYLSKYLHQVVAPPPKPPLPSGQKVYLPKTATSWRVYPLNKQPIIGNEVGTLAPSKYGGLSYTILGRPYAYVYTIQTQTYGRVNIFAGPCTGATVK